MATKKMRAAKGETRALDPKSSALDRRGTPPNGRRSHSSYPKPRVGPFDFVASSEPLAFEELNWETAPGEWETGLVYMRNRYYDPELGRFISADPMGYVDGPSTYGFSGNSPHNLTDPLGLAAFFFDGTWNYTSADGSETHGSDVPTNVWKMWKASNEPNSLYFGGIANEFEYGDFTRVFGGLTGYTGRRILGRAYRELWDAYNCDGDQTIDIVGFSRGGALALEFANMIASVGIPKVDCATGLFMGGFHKVPEIRFIGLFDVVGSFGLPGNQLNLTYDLELPTDLSIGGAFHAVALNETRTGYPVTDVQGALQVGFIGVHSDIGGGYADTGLSNISLAWMLRKAKSTGLEFNSSLNDLPANPIMQPHDNDTWLYKNGPRVMPGGLSFYDPSAYQLMFILHASKSPFSKYWPLPPGWPQRKAPPRLPWAQL
ncbi:MAG: DUF2235 domain-containing protein [Thermoanaerobaculia bacterium]